LEGKISFMEISNLIYKILESAYFKKPEDINDVYQIINETKSLVEKISGGMVC